MNSSVSKWLRHSVFERDSYTCIFCDMAATDVHHVVPRSQGGRNVIFNLVSLCRRCHMVHHGTLNEVYPNMRNEMYEVMTEYLWHAHPDEMLNEQQRE